MDIDMVALESIIIIPVPVAAKREALEELEEMREKRAGQEALERVGEGLEIENECS